MTEQEVPTCFHCVHLKNWWKKITETDTPVYTCQMIERDITFYDFVIDCEKFYAENFDD